MSPSQLVAAADLQGLAAIAITDHDTLSGLAEARTAAAATPDLRFIPGIEVSARFDAGTMHILGLGIDPENEALGKMTLRMRQARDRRNPEIIRKLREMGIDISDQDVAAVAREMHGRQDCAVTSRVHIAETLRRLGRASSIADAFDRYIGKEAPAYVSRDRPASGEIIATIARAGGLPILTHPPQLNCTNRAQLERIVRELKAHGLLGIEAYHSSHTPAQTRQYLDLARRLGLGVSGGSDFHGSVRAEMQLARPRVPVSALTAPISALLAN